MAARKGRGNIDFSFNSVALESYTTQAELSMVVDRIETTHFASTGAESIAGDTTYTISLSGDWDTALDTALAPEAITTGTRRTAVLVVTGSSTAVTYTWTSLAEVASYSISADASGKITFQAEISLAGAPSSRSVA
jgi:hypothetical protein